MPLIKRNNMKTIGITGGVGAGKSLVLSLLKEMTNCEIIMADDVASPCILREIKPLKT